MLSIQPGLRGSNDLRVERKMANFQLFLSVQGIADRTTWLNPKNRVGDQDNGSPGRPVSLGSKCSVSQGIVVQEQEPLGEIPPTLSLQNVLQLHHQRLVILSNTKLTVWPFER